MHTTRTVSRWYAVAALAVATANPAAAQSPAVSVGTLIYTQFAYQLRTDSVSDSRLNGFDLTRAYINIVGKFPSGLTARITPDIYRGADGSLNFRLKYAYAAWTLPHGALTPKFGVLHTPWLDWEEALWDYRMQGTMAMERFRNPAGTAYLSSADLGFGVDGKFRNDAINFQVGLYDGEFYTRPEGDQYKDFEARVSVRLLESDDPSRVGGLRVTGYGAIGTPTGGGRRNRYMGMISYKSTLFTLAGEYGRARDRIDNGPPVTGTPPPAPIPTTDADIWSFFGVLHVPHSKAAVVARWDMLRPDTDVVGNRQYRVIGGVSYQLTPEVRLLADIDNLWLQSGAYTNAINSTRTTGLVQMQVAF